MLKELHHGMERIKNNSTIGVKYMQMWEILELLEDIGTVSDSLKRTISSQNDMNILNKWHKLSAKVTTIDEFMKKMN